MVAVMAVDWTLPVGTVLTVTMTVIGLLGAFFAFSWNVQKAISEKFATMQLEFTKSLSDLKIDITREVTETRTTAVRDTTLLKDEMLRALNKTEREQHDLMSRTVALETGQSEWIKSLRARTHDLSNHLHALETKVELIACGVSVQHLHARKEDPKGP